LGSSLTSSGSFLDPSELLEIQIKWVVYDVMCDYVACVADCQGSIRNHENPAHRPRNHTLYSYDTPPNGLTYDLFYLTCYQIPD
jgi:hypothetical protein